MNVCLRINVGLIQSANATDHNCILETLITRLVFDILALFGMIIRSLCEKIRSTGAELAGTHYSLENGDFKETPLSS